MRLNEMQKEIINHRPIDCIIEVAFDRTEDDDPSILEKVFGSDDVGQTAAGDFVATTIDKWLKDGIIDVQNLSEAEQYVLWDIIDGSTAACCYVDDIDNNGRAIPYQGHQKEYAKVCRAGRALAKEYSKYHGQVIFPVR